MKLVMVMLFAALGTSGCNHKNIEMESYGPGEINKWQDPNYQIIPVGSYNYTDYDIYGVYLLPLDKNDIAYAASTTGGRATAQTATRWEGVGGSADLAWDLRWRAPRTFKVWWHRVVDKDLLRRSLPFPKGGEMYDPYDPYTTKLTRPGEAWCEYFVEIKETFGEPFGPPFPYRVRDRMTLYFYPDGTVRGHLEYGADSDILIEDISRRNELPQLAGKSCIKEVSNPLYGKARPLTIN